MIKDDHEPALSDVLQPGKNMLAAGYCMYGSSCTVYKIAYSVFNFITIFWLGLQFNHSVDEFSLDIYLVIFTVTSY